MGRHTRPSASRLETILTRQDPPGRRADYIPSIKATRSEAPAKSRFAQVKSPKLGRKIHVLSTVEKQTLLLALYSPSLIDLHEQRMLAMEPRPHPLEGHPSVTGEELPPLMGTIAVAHRLDCLHLHPSFKMKIKDGSSIKVEFPWIGDLLLFLTDADGPYCVNWDIKKDDQGFEQSSVRSRPVRNPERDAEKVKMRHAIEELYYLDAGIRTVRVTESDVPPRLEENLRRLYASSVQDDGLDGEIRELLIERLRGGMLLGKPPLEIFLALKLQYGIEVRQCKLAMESAIWNRSLRVELYGDPILPDLPLIPEKRDVLKQYAHWFSREED